MILWEKTDCSPDWTELLSILADLAKLTEKCSKNCGLLPKTITGLFSLIFVTQTLENRSDYLWVSRFTGTGRNGPERAGTDRNGPERTQKQTVSSPVLSI